MAVLAPLMMPVVVPVLALIVALAAGFGLMIVLNVSKDRAQRWLLAALCVIAIVIFWLNWTNVAHAETATSAPTIQGTTTQAPAPTTVKPTNPTKPPVTTTADEQPYPDPNREFCDSLEKYGWWWYFWGCNAYER